jgi:hypothetical protein
MTCICETLGRLEVMEARHDLFADGRSPRYLSRLEGSGAWSPEIAHVRRTAIKAEERRLYLVTAGGVEVEKCSWGGCEHRRAKGRALCIEHLIP